MKLEFSVTEGLSPITTTVTVVDNSLIRSDGSILPDTLAQVITDLSRTLIEAHLRTVVSSQQAALAEASKEIAALRKETAAAEDGRAA